MDRKTPYAFNDSDSPEETPAPTAGRRKLFGNTHSSLAPSSTRTHRAPPTQKPHTCRLAMMSDPKQPAQAKTASNNPHTHSMPDTSHTLKSKPKQPAQTNGSKAHAAKQKPVQSEAEQEQQPETEAEENPAKEPAPKKQKTVSRPAQLALMMPEPVALKRASAQRVLVEVEGIDLAGDTGMVGRFSKAPNAGRAEGGKSGPQQTSMGMDLKGRQYDLQTMQPPVTLLTVGIPKNGTQATIEGVFSSFVAATPIDDDKQSTADYGMTHSDDEHSTNGVTAEKTEKKKPKAARKSPKKQKSRAKGSRGGGTAKRSAPKKGK